MTHSVICNLWLVVSDKNQMIVVGCKEKQDGQQLIKFLVCELVISGSEFVVKSGSTRTKMVHTLTWLLTNSEQMMFQP